MAEVRLEGVSKRFGNNEVLAGLSLTVQDGEFFTIVGPSGCGKSTLLHLIAGIETPTEGRILIDGSDVTRRSPPERNVAVVFQSYALYPHMTVAENLAFPLRVVGRQANLGRKTIEEEVDRVATLLGLNALLARRPRELSGGQRQRVALGRAMIRKPSVFLLDEPLSNLDAQLRAGMRAELRRLHDEHGMTMIYVTHDQTEALTLADRLALLHRGTLQQVGTAQDLYDRPDNVFVASFIGYPAMNIWDGEIESDHLVVGPFRLPLPSGLRRPISESLMKVGIRPEQVKVVKPCGATSPEEANGTIRLMEPAGGQSWVTAEIMTNSGPRTTVGSAEVGFAARLGDPVTLSVAGATIHLFDHHTGLRLEQMT
jgi:multiple sugar transport system ATP-binding protein